MRMGVLVRATLSTGPCRTRSRHPANEARGQNIHTLSWGFSRTSKGKHLGLRSRKAQPRLRPRGCRGRPRGHFGLCHPDRGPRPQSPQETWQRSTLQLLCPVPSARQEPSGEGAWEPSVLAHEVHRSCGDSRFLADWTLPAPPAQLSALRMQRSACPGWGGRVSPPLRGSGLGHPASGH